MKEKIDKGCFFIVMLTRLKSALRARPRCARMESRSGLTSSTPMVRTYTLDRPQMPPGPTTSPSHSIIKYRFIPTLKSHRFYKRFLPNTDYDPKLLAFDKYIFIICFLSLPEIFLVFKFLVSLSLKILAKIFQFLSGESFKFRHDTVSLNIITFTGIYIFV